MERGSIPTYCSAVSWADAATGRRAGSYLLRYARSHGIGIADALIAAAASTTGLQLWTLNRRHYPMDDLRLFAAAAPEG